MFINLSKFFTVTLLKFLIIFIPAQFMHECMDFVLFKNNLNLIRSFSLVKSTLST